MKFRLVSAVCLTLGIAGLAPAADPQLMGLVMPEAKALAGVNLVRARTTPFGQFLLTQVQQGHHDLDELIAATGFDPRQDLDELLFASTGEPGPDHGLALVRGRFDIPRIVEAAAKKGSVAETYQGVQILGDPKHGKALAFLDSTLAVAGSTARVRAAIDRRSAAAALDPALVVKANELSAIQDAWAVSLAPLPAPGHAHPAPQGPAGFNPDLLRKIEQSSGGVKFGTNVVISAEALAQTDKDATALADVLRFLAGMAQWSDKTGDAAALLKTLVVTTDGKTLKASLSIPEEQIERLIRQSHGRRATTHVHFSH